VVWKATVGIAVYVGDNASVIFEQRKCKKSADAVAAVDDDSMAGLDLDMAKEILLVQSRHIRFG